METFKSATIFATGALALLALVGCSDDSTDSAPTPSTVTSVETESITQVPTSTAEATPTTEVPTTPSIATSMGSGTFVVGTDVAAGTYKTSGPADSTAGCAYTFLPRRGASLSEATGGNTFFGPGYMEVADGQVVQTINCNWTLEP